MSLCQLIILREGGRGSNCTVIYKKINDGNIIENLRKKYAETFFANRVELTRCRFLTLN